MENYLLQWGELVEELNIPSFVAGDLFHRYNPSPRLLHFAMEALPENVYAIPGQHDLPYHNYHDVRGSGFGVLGLAKFINPDTYWNGENYYQFRQQPDLARSITAYAGFAWRENPDQNILKCPPAWIKSSVIRVAYTHEYCWSGEHRFMNADKNYAQQRADIVWERYKDHGYTHVFCGDNHKGFIDGQVGNTGTFIRRRLDEMDYRPFGIILYSDGTMKQHFWDTSKDKFMIEQEQLAELKLNDASLERVIQSLQTTLDLSFNYVDNLKKESARQKAGVRTFINRVLDELK